MAAGIELLKPASANSGRLIAMDHPDAIKNAIKVLTHRNRKKKNITEVHAATTSSTNRYASNGVCG